MKKDGKLMKILNAINILKWLNRLRKVIVNLEKVIRLLEVFAVEKETIKVSTIESLQREIISQNTAILNLKGRIETYRKEFSRISPNESRPIISAFISEFPEKFPKWNR